MGRYKQILEKLLEEYSLEEWWPTFSECEEDRIFEMIIGLILTKQMDWIRAKAILKKMKVADLLKPRRIVEFGEEGLRDFLKMEGVNLYRQKAKQIHKTSEIIVEKYESVLKLAVAKDIDEAKKRLMELSGIGQEFSEYLLLYAFDIPYLPKDKVIKTVLEKISGKSFEEARKEIESEFGHLTKNYKMLHASLFEHGKKYCLNSKCKECRIQDLCENYKG